MSRLPLNPVDIAIPELRAQAIQRENDRRLDASDRMGDFWHPLVLQNGWTNYDGRITAAYKKINGIVWVRGLVKDGPVPSTVFQLPEGYRTGWTSHMHLPVAAGGEFGYVRIDSTGNVEVTSGFNSWVDLSAISFPAG